jgi:glycosyltransferase involved in cell wall biosynthesis
MKAKSHIVIVEAYEGLIEFLSDEQNEYHSARAIGLPAEEISEHIGCRITVLCWDEWYRYERSKIWVTFPLTQPASIIDEQYISSRFTSGNVRRLPIPPRDPDYLRNFDKMGLSPRSYGLINDSGLLFFASYCLNKELQSLFTKDPFHVVVMPMWGGIGYVPQMTRATQAPNLVDVPFAVVVTDTSANRHKANQEGIWGRHAIVRRQMEEISLALADLVLVFGPRGNKIACDGRLPEAAPPVLSPRFVDRALLNEIEQVATRRFPSEDPIQFFIHEPQEPASGVLATLDAVRLLSENGVCFQKPVISGGPSMIFAPMSPRTFTEYWSSRGAVNELIHEHQWLWKEDYPHLERVIPIRLYPSFFDHLPNVWSELARGSLVILSAAASEGLTTEKSLPEEVLIEEEPHPYNIARCLGKMLQMDRHLLDYIRQELCNRVVAGHKCTIRDQRLEQTANALECLIHSPPEMQDLSRIALLLLDRRSPLRSLAKEVKRLSLRKVETLRKDKSLSVVVTCYEMGSMIEEAIESVWASYLCPDEVLLIDDGSHGPETLKSITALERKASKRNLPLKVIRQRNKGLAASRNTGLEAASGEFISFLDGDDLIEPAFYQTALRLLRRFPRLGGVASWAYIFGPEITDGFWCAPQAELPFLFIENTVIVPCVMHTQLIRDLGGYDTRLRYNYEDWELSIRMLVSGWPIVTIPLQLLRYRVRGNSIYRSMTIAQNQVMRELFLGKHRDIVSKFGTEIAMQLEYNWMSIRDRLPRPSPGSLTRSEPFADVRKRIYCVLKKALYRMLSS